MVTFYQIVMLMVSKSEMIFLQMRRNEVLKVGMYHVGSYRICSCIAHIFTLEHPKFN